MLTQGTSEHSEDKRNCMLSVGNKERLLGFEFFHEQARCQEKNMVWYYHSFVMLSLP